ncbi:hypothetical protein CKQ84_22050 [Shewanella sp. WE21]|nr:hypothetical protein CKQ84_22050 [Shewanella sp. WE21]
MANGKFALRVGGFNAQRIGVFKTPRGLGHRCGDFIYKKTSQTNAELMTDLSKFKSFTKDSVGLIGVSVGYVDWGKGNDNTGDGLSWATAKGSLSAGYSLNTDILLVRAGFYNRANRLGAISLNKSRAIIAIGGIVITGCIATGIWTKTTGKTNVYQMNYTSGLTNVTSSVYDTAVLNEQISPTSYQGLDSIVEVDATPGSFYHDAAAFITYVHAVDSRDLVMHGNELRLTQPVESSVITWTGNFKLYVENIEFWGGDIGNCIKLISNGGNYKNSVFYNKNCTFAGTRDGTGGNGLAVRDIGICISDDSICTANRRDGFNYHAWLAGESGVQGLNPHFVEVNCRAHGNGINGDESNNQ